jgi:serine/threonine protein kinase
MKPLPTPAEIAKRFPQFELLECLGRGDTGVIYKARQPGLNRIVALKILAPKKVAEPRFAERFQRESQALARLNHPNIVRVFDFGEADGLYYLLMEFVDGFSLRQLLQARKISPDVALAIVPKICAALEFAHEQGVVHGDIRPENVLLDNRGRVMIADFGIARIVGESAPEIPSPGLTATQTVDHHADIYSAGVVFYEMLTGKSPPGKFQPPSKKVQVVVRLDEVVLHALERESELRYQEAHHLKTDVETISRSEPRTPQHQASAPAGALRHLIWALVNLLRPEVRLAFAQEPERRN